MHNQTGSLNLIKRINRSLVLDLIRKEQPISRALIAKKLGLSRSTVTGIVNELLAKKFVVETGFADSTTEGGRRGIELGFNPKSGFGIGVDVGRTKSLVIFTDLDGAIVHRSEHRTSASLTEFIRQVHADIEEAGVDSKRILGMGIGLPGIVNSDTGQILDVPALEWGPINVIDAMKDQFPFPVHVNNDVNCAALGERWQARDGRCDNMFFIAIGSGVGSAIIANGSLIEGYSYSAGEINNLLDREDLRMGRMPLANGTGVFEQQISGKALAESGVPAEELFRRYRDGDAAARDRIHEFADYLSVTIANVVSLLNPENVMIGGGVSGSMDAIIERVRKKVAELTPIRTKISLARLGSDAGGIGAVAYVFQKLQDAEDL
jgi:Transcriptional regulator/sugar kinase